MQIIHHSSSCLSPHTLLSTLLGEAPELQHHEVQLSCRLEQQESARLAPAVLCIFHCSLFFGYKKYQFSIAV